ncbi:MAG: adenosylcobinamide-phosphate synthase CbiB [Candidatus Latescibacterota bacterium]|jgi:adenosylcobinamide-phosphate synthase
MDLSPLRPEPLLLLAALALDGLIGDPIYRLHPIRLLCATLTRIENALRALRLDGYIGGCLLFGILALLGVGEISGAVLYMEQVYSGLSWVFHLYILYSLIALRDLLKHGLAIDRAAHADDLEGARLAASMLVGRDTSRMDLAACRRAGMESLSENAVDGFVSPLFFYALLGLPGLMLFKVISTMDSMVGNKSPRYLRFGWCGARLDDLFNWFPARLSYLLMAFVALLLPECSARKALAVGWHQHALVPGPNSGWSEAATAGAIQRRLVGPIWQNGELVTEVWLGDADDPAGGQPGDIGRTCIFVTATCLLFSAMILLYIVAFA